MLKTPAKGGNTIVLIPDKEDDAAQSQVSETGDYHETVVNTFPDQKTAIIETLWSSKEPWGSKEIQETYVRELAGDVRAERHQSRKRAVSLVRSVTSPL